MKDTKTMIILAALELFGKKGFSKVSIKEIAKLAEVSQVTIYNNFANKEVLVEEVVAVLMEDISKATDEIYSADLPYDEKLKKAFMVCSKEEMKSLEKYFTPESLEDPKLEKLITQAMNSHKEKIYKRFIELGIASKKISNTLDQRSILYLLRAINSSGLTDELDLSHERLNLDLIHLFLYGILGNEKRTLQELTGEDVLKLLTVQVKNELEKGER
ncbi:TetR/AcrR family transcriptional regulator [Enterococcus sp. AZ109]|uniref:TetR/AcrR family transcriptional regulator n=1 Tax=Enterococcus sp. AZ109 TaxID=2774634 RepID=UPI003F1EB06F